ncbi:MAG: zinc ribbon domain-containing protein [bacterium]
MPIYEYACSGCGTELEVWQKISERPKKVCPSCGAHRLDRLISNTSFQLKGTGWYVTDYAKKGSSPPAPAKAEPPKKSAKDSSDE